MLVSGQTAISSTAATAVCTLPPGAYDVVLSNIGPGTVCAGETPGAGQSLTAGNGYLMGPGQAPTHFRAFTGSKGSGLSACATVNGSTATLSYLISTEA